jgi:hypothetical protein
VDLRLAAFALALAVVLATPAPAAAQTPGSTGGTPAERRDEALRLDSAEAIRIAERDPNVREAEAERDELEPVTQAKPPDTWQVGFKDGEDEVVQVLVDDRSGTVRESWTGYQVEWQMARGYEGSFGGVLNAPWVWLPLCAVFLLGLLDLRRLRRIVHLDLLVLLGFGASHLFFNRGEIGLSVPLVYPVLLYLLARMLWIGFWGPGEGLRPSAPTLLLLAGAAFLLAFRLVVNVADSGVIDVGYAGVIGADLLAHGEPVWGEAAFPEDNSFGDTYGPANYFAYLPFELAWPWSGSWDEVPAAHAAALAFDFATATGLYVLGRRWRPGDAGQKLSATLLFAWAAYPYSAYTLAANANDSLLAALLVWSLVAFASPLARGALLAFAAGVKFAPLALAPLYAAGERGFRLGRRRVERRWPRRAAFLFAAALLITTAVLLAHPAIDPGLATFYDRTIGSQVDRDSPFSVWGQAGLEPLRLLVELATVTLAVALAFVPRDRGLVQVAALAAAVLIAVQLTADHWFYLYIVWFFPPLIAALAGRGSDPIDSTRRTSRDDSWGQTPLRPPPPPAPSPDRSSERGRPRRSPPRRPSPRRPPRRSGSGSASGS